MLRFWLNLSGSVEKYSALFFSPPETFVNKQVPFETKIGSTIPFLCRIYNLEGQRSVINFKHHCIPVTSIGLLDSCFYIYVCDCLKTFFFFFLLMNVTWSFHIISLCCAALTTKTLTTKNEGRRFSKLLLINWHESNPNVSWRFPAVISWLPMCHLFSSFVFWYQRKKYPVITALISFFCGVEGRLLYS